MVFVPVSRRATISRPLWWVLLEITSEPNATSLTGTIQKSKPDWCCNTLVHLISSFVDPALPYVSAYGSPNITLLCKLVSRVKKTLKVPKEKWLSRAWLRNVGDTSSSPSFPDWNAYAFGAKPKIPCNSLLPEVWSARVNSNGELKQFSFSFKHNVSVEKVPFVNYVPP